MTTEICDNKLIITIELSTPHPSKTGKTNVIASTHGNQPTSAQIGGKVVFVGLNAYVQK